MIFKVYPFRRYSKDIKECKIFQHGGVNVKSTAAFADSLIELTNAVPLTQRPLRPDCMHIADRSSNKYPFVCLYDLGIE